jgi:hypothetical protein
MAEFLAKADNQEREALAIRRLLALDFYLAPIMKSLGLSLFSWYIVDIKHQQLVNTPRDGDVDILAGKLAWNDVEQTKTLLTEIRDGTPKLPQYLCEQILAKDGRLKWPPPTDYLVGIEAKCAINKNPESSEISPDDIKAGKTSHGKQHSIGQQIDRLLEMGFNKVALFDFIANPPITSHIDGYPWLSAGMVAARSAAAMSQKKESSNSSLQTKGLLQGRLPPNSPAGHWLIPMGAVDGADDPFLQNPEVSSRRMEMEKSLATILGNFPVPRLLPVVFVCCRISGKMYRYIPFEDVCLLS